MPNKRLIKNIFAVTGSRSEYDIFYPILKAIHEDKELSLKLFVCGAHLSRSFDNTIELIKKDGIPIFDQSPCLIDSDNRLGRLKTLALEINDLGQSMSRAKPDLVLAIGDREEAMATALAAGYLDIPVAHIGGGDRVRGNIDDQVRFAVAKLSQLHFTGTEKNAERLRKMAEEPFRVHAVGNAGLDRIRNCPEMNELELQKLLNFENPLNQSILFIQHVISSEVEQATEQIKCSLNALRKSGRKVLAGLPNSDAGSGAIVSELKKAANEGFLHFYSNLPRIPFVNLLRKVGCLVGNSSLGILEAPFLKLPVVNIGNRQWGREHGENVLFTDFNENEICSAIDKCFKDSQFQNAVKNGQNPYGDGFTAEKIVKIIKETSLSKDFLNKFPSY